MATLMSASPRASVERWRHPAILAVPLACTGLFLTAAEISARIPLSLIWHAFWSPDPNDLAQLIVHFSLFPRVSAAVLGGAGLGLAGCLTQHVLHNPLAEPSTLGISAGAYLAMTIVALWFPSGFVGWREGAALAGAGTITVVVFALVWREALSPISLILAGLVASLYSGAMATFMLLLHDQYLDALSIWGSGSLVQENWLATKHLFPVLCAAILYVRLDMRSLVALGLGDTVSSSLGLGVARTRFLALAVAAALTASLVASVGVIGFVGLGAPVLCRMLGARRLDQRVFWSPVLGGMLLWVTDQTIVAGGALWGDIPTGAVAALLGAPFLIWVSGRAGHERPIPSPDIRRIRVLQRPMLLLILYAASLLVAMIVALYVGKSGDGWSIASGGDVARLAVWRVPRVVGACAAGAMLSMAGALLQRVTGNAMASPELIGISAGASLALILMVWIGEVGALPIGFAAALGSLGVSILLLTAGWRSSFSPQKVILVGIGLSTFLSALMSALLATGDPRGRQILNWLSGSTYQISMAEAVAALISALLLLSVIPLLVRWLDILPLGDTVAASVGIHLRWSRLATLAFVSIATAIATVVVGPLSFVGLMAPHIVRLSGMRRPLSESIGAALVGATLMTVADWLGRNLLFPYQMPAGLIATLLGGPYVVWLIVRCRIA
jgi:iron complex transport system permease protein